MNQLWREQSFRLNDFEVELWTIFLRGNRIQIFSSSIENCTHPVKPSQSAKTVGGRQNWANQLLKYLKSFSFDRFGP